MSGLVPSQQRFFASTQGKIVTLLRRNSQTVEELANTLGLTDNAVRAHLLTLERDGLVQQRGVRAGKRKPSVIYDLTPAAEELFPKAYGPVLSHLLEVLGERLTAEEIAELLQAVGSQMAASEPAPSGNLSARLQRAVAALNALGGLAELEPDQERPIIRGARCPLAAVARDHPEVCQLAASLLTALIGLPVSEQCEHTEHPTCHFVVSPSL